MGQGLEQLLLQLAHPLGLLLDPQLTLPLFPYAVLLFFGQLDELLVAPLLLLIDQLLGELLLLGHAFRTYVE
jgi:hypothetical protein